jgi:uncharacterized RDD family membrane protein YckC
MMKKIVITTPEEVEFCYELAGPGSRFLAIVIDMLIKSAALIAVWAILVIVETFLKLDKGAFSLHVMSSSLAMTTLVLGALGGFIMVGYYVFFEVLWNGQTPGKRVVGLRVVKENGASITIVDAAIRNFLRAVDFLPFFYILGTIVMMGSRQNTRIGDLAARTVVVKIAAPAGPVLLPEMEIDAPPHVPDISCCTESDYNLVRNFIMRRNSLSSSVRARLAAVISSALLVRMGCHEHPFTHSQSQAYDEDFLEWFVVERSRKPSVSGGTGRQGGDRQGRSVGAITPADHPSRGK